jgi:hypothetical protein
VLVHQVFVFAKVAVVVGPWWEPAVPPERGTRVELRFRADEPPRGSPSAAQRIVIDQPVFRADLFDQTDAPPGNLRAAHFHEGFDGVEPRDRVWPPGIGTDPIGWLCAELGDLHTLLERAGVATTGGPGIDRDAAALREALPAIAAAVEATWRAVRAEPTDATVSSQGV